MEIDFQMPFAMGGLIVFPDYALAAQPLQPSQIEETTVITGSSTGTSISIEGSVGPFQV